MGTISKTGIKQIALCDGNTIANNAATAMAMGIRAGASLKRGVYKPIKDSLSRNWRNMINFRVEAETYQPSMLLLSKMIAWLNGNVDAQIVTNKQTSGASNGDCYIFKQAASTNLGLDFELMMNADKRSLKATLEGALPYAAAQALIDAADSVTPYTFASSSIPFSGAGENETLFRKPAFAEFKFPNDTTVLYRDEIVERSYSIKTKSKKSVETNMSIVDYLSFELIIKFRNASIAKQVEIMSKDNSPSILIKEYNNASDNSEYDGFAFNTGMLTLDDEFEANDEDRHQTLKFVGDVFLFKNNFDLTLGDPVNENGTLGGTMLVGY